MARQKKTRKISDIMPVRKENKKTPTPTGKKLTRYELDAKSREDKKKRKHKGLTSGSRNAQSEKKINKNLKENKDPRIGSRRKVPLVVEFVNKPAKSQSIAKVIDPALELENLENNEILNELLDRLDEGESLNQTDQQFVDECLDRIAQLMQELGIEDETDDDLYHTFEKIDINQFR